MSDLTECYDCVAIGPGAMANAIDCHNVVAVGSGCLSDLRRGRRIVAIGQNIQVPDGSSDLIVIAGLILTSGDLAAYDALNDKLRPFILVMIRKVQLGETLVREN